MKKSVVLSLLGLAAIATTSAYGQGGINIGNYRGAYNPVVWDSSTGLSGPVMSTQGVQLALWYGAGVAATDSQLDQSVALTWKTDSEAQGYFGYYNAVTLDLPSWTPGQTYSFQVRAFGDSVVGTVNTVASRSVIWQESSNIGDISGTPPGLAGISANSIGLTVSVPEPSTLALAGLGLAALAAFRRRS